MDRYVGILLDQVVFFHHQKRKESHATRTFWNSDFVLARAAACR
jgi:diaminopimelate epimerase